MTIYFLFLTLAVIVWSVLRSPGVPVNNAFAAYQKMCGGWGGVGITSTSALDPGTIIYTCKK